MRRILSLALTLFVPFPAFGNFKTEQARNARVKGAYTHKEKEVRALFAEKGIAYPPQQIFLRAFKRDRALELWAKGKENPFRLVKTFRVCALSGDLGPKRRSGDRQIPEGFYTVSGFNPASNYHLSLRVSYPNESDRRLSTHRQLGGDIFIHGDCVTIGCLPLKDEGIEELYVIAVDTKNASGDPIPVHIFPAKLTEATMKALSLEYASLPRNLEHWKNLKEGYDDFEKERKLPDVSVGADGRYRFTATK